MMLYSFAKATAYEGYCMLLDSFWKCRGIKITDTRVVYPLPILYSKDYALAEVFALAGALGAFAERCICFFSLIRADLP